MQHSETIPNGMNKICLIKETVRN
uniref:Uncharacterized protein n=1 Tax=Arundo donax TaxID=35708 RepID=A0A0A9BJ88_ARUDO